LQAGAQKEKATSRRLGAFHLDYGASQDHGAKRRTPGTRVGGRQYQSAVEKVQSSRFNVLRAVPGLHFQAGALSGSPQVILASLLDCQSEGGKRDKPKVWRAFHLDYGASQDHGAKRRTPGTRVGSGSWQSHLVHLLLLPCLNIPGSLLIVPKENTAYLKGAPVRVLKVKF